MLAILKVSGTISAEPIELFEAARAALEYPGPSTLILDIDCNGAVSSTLFDGLCEMVYQKRAQKRTIAYISGDALSGGLQLASAFRHVFAAPAARLGSVKVRAISAHHPDVTLAVAGTYTEGAFGEIEEDAERVRVQQHAALEHEMFRDLLARYRGLSFEEVCEKFGDGAIYSADEAARRGMVDAVMTKAELRAWLASKEQSEKAGSINPCAD